MIYKITHFMTLLFLLISPSLALAGQQLHKLDVKIGAFKSGQRNLISDVPGVRVGMPP